MQLRLKLSLFVKVKANAQTGVSTYGYKMTYFKKKCTGLNKVQKHNRILHKTKMIGSRDLGMGLNLSLHLPRNVCAPV